MKKQKANSHEGITWSETGKQNIQAKEVYITALINVVFYSATNRDALNNFSVNFVFPPLFLILFLILFLFSLVS